MPSPDDFDILFYFCVGVYIRGGERLREIGVEEATVAMWRN